VNYLTTPWVKLYRAPDADWVRLPLSARGLGSESLKYARQEDGFLIDTEGESLGIALAYFMGARPSEHERIQADADRLLAHGFYEMRGTRVFVRNFVDAQTRQSAAALRKARQRAKQKAEQEAERDMERDVSRDVSRGVCHAMSQGIETNRIEPNRIEPKPTQKPKPPPKPKPEQPQLPFQIADALKALAEASKGKIITAPFDKAFAAPLTEAIREHPDLTDWRLVGEHAAAGAFAWMHDPPGLRWLAKSGNLADAIGKAKAWERSGKPQQPRTVNGTHDPPKPPWVREPPKHRSFREIWAEEEAEKKRLRAEQDAAELEAQRAGAGSSS
jgi:hypothetical protein